MPTAEKFLLCMLALVVLLPIIYITIGVLRNPNEENEKIEEGKRTPRITPKVTGAIMVILGIVLLFMAAARAWTWYGQHSPTAVQTETFVQQRGILTWHKPKGYAGGNPNLRSFSCNAVMQRNNSEVMEFITEYTYGGEVQKTYFTLDKRTKRGEWHQNYPKRCGLWYLEPEEGTRRYVGWESDETDVHLPLELMLS